MHRLNKQTKEPAL